MNMLVIRTNFASTQEDLRNNYYLSFPDFFST